jgi:hypothetical protein
LFWWDCSYSLRFPKLLERNFAVFTNFVNLKTGTAFVNSVLRVLITIRKSIKSHRAVNVINVRSVPPAPKYVIVAKAIRVAKANAWINQKVRAQTVRLDYLWTV